MPTVSHLVLPDSWRVELLRRPKERDGWLTALEAHPCIALIDWVSPRPAAGDLVIVAGLDLAAAELVLKLHPETRVFAANTSWAAFPWGGRAQLLERAWRRVQRRLSVSHQGHTLPLAPAGYLGMLISAAEAAR